jgi:hypothetical protein
MNWSKKISHLSITSLRSRGLAWMTLWIFFCSFAPSISLAQQPTATIESFSGAVLVNGVQQEQGMILQAGDVIDTAEDSIVVLKLSDGSLLEIQENTRVDLATLLQTSTGARVSRVKLLWGEIRAKLSGKHQQTGSSFDIETPNALIGVKFSSPDVGGSYDPEKNESRAFAYTVPLQVTNLLTNEVALVPVGSMAVISAVGIQIMTLTAAGVTTAGSIGAEATKMGTTTEGLLAGMSTKTVAIVGAGALVGVGGLVAIAGGGNGDGEATSSCDEEQVAGENIPETRVIELGQRSGTFEFYYDTYSIPDRMVVEYEGSVLFDTGCVGDEGSVFLSYSGKSSKVTVRVTPNCSGTTYTAWEFTVFCPR